MAKKEHTDYQKKVISRYYQNLDSIMLNNLQELVTELYLADSPKKAERLWKRAQNAMEKIKVKPEIIEHIMEKRSVEILAKNVQDWLKIAKK